MGLFYPNCLLLDRRIGNAMRFHYVTGFRNHRGCGRNSNSTGSNDFFREPQIGDYRLLTWEPRSSYGIASSMRAGWSSEINQLPIGEAFSYYLGEDAFPKLFRKNATAYSILQKNKEIMHKELIRSFWRDFLCGPGLGSAASFGRRWIHDQVRNPLDQFICI
jgi:hypothetical protein